MRLDEGDLGPHWFFMDERSARDRVLDYHERTKHHFGRMARSLGYMDWETQPHPFRRYRGAAPVVLDEVEPTETPSFDDLERPWAQSPIALSHRSISQLLYDSLALSAWKAAGRSRWSLRCNPSSGNLHPTEAYLLSGPCEGLEGGLYHYTADLHLLERRRAVSGELWERLSAGLPAGAALMGLSSIFWRESWKYGERAFRYCQHDVGHALAAITYAAAALGWQVRLLEGIGDAEVARLLAIDDQRGPEREHADALVAIAPAAVEIPAAWRPVPEVIDELAAEPLDGEANQLSRDHHLWPVIDEVAEASQKEGSARMEVSARAEGPPPSSLSPRPQPGRRLLRQRRSAVAMDGRTWLELDDFARMMAAVMPDQRRPPLSFVTWPAAVHLAVFVHRVRGLEPGLYLLARRDEALEPLRRTMGNELEWAPVDEGALSSLPLRRMVADDFRRQAELVSCQQSIAADSAFALSMVAELGEGLERHGPWFYRRLHWEAGAIGQALYLEAEAAGVRATGIGCFFDDAMHELLGLAEDGSEQALYHFTVGGSVEDRRLRTLPPYFHRAEALAAEGLSS